VASLSPGPGGVIDPVQFQELCWPDITLYDKQREILYSVRDNDETFVPAGNMLGKDFVAALCTLWFFISRHPCRIITTSVDGTQLESVLWGEIRRFIQSSRHRLPLVVNHLHLRKTIGDSVDGLSYVLGRVAAKGEGMLGHHVARVGDGIPRTLFVADEASGVDNISYERADTWADRKLVIGNPYPCTNFFKKGVQAGNVQAPSNGHLYRNVIRIRAEDSPNVRLATAQQQAGNPVTGEMLIPGVMDHDTYTKRRSTWDSIRQCIGLDAEFYEGAEVLLYPPEWLNRAEALAASLEGHTRRAALTIGVDPAEGGDNTCWAVVDELGLIDLISKKTPDTTVITGDTIALMQQYGVTATNVLLDAGGGGKQHADRLRSQGYPVRTVAFGESATPVPARRLKTMGERAIDREERYVYKNRRAEMYGILRELLDPAVEPGFALPAQYTALRHQLSPIPLVYDGEGRLELPPKTKPNPTSTKVTLTELIGHSPDEADALALAVYGMRSKAAQAVAGAVV